MRRRLSDLFVDREFFMRSHGEVRFIKVSAIVQRRVALTVALIFGLWALAMMVVMVGGAFMAHDRAVLSARQARVTTDAARVSAYRSEVDAVVRQLRERQDFLEQSYRQSFGALPAPSPAPAGHAAAAARHLGAAVPALNAAGMIESRQFALAGAMTQVADRRIALDIAAIRRLGLNPDALSRTMAEGQGGPLIPAFADRQADDPRFATLAAALSRMTTLQHVLAQIPTGMPANVPALTSSFGYRVDPFTGRTAMHPGLDFAGPYGSPILAAADGTVSFVGQRNGYGNVVEITHGGGIMTRYGHLSGFTTHVGAHVLRGQQIARMGSTGRSTGTHLHFEVRVDGVAENPNRFLEHHDVYQSKAG